MTNSLSFREKKSRFKCFKKNPNKIRSNKVDVTIHSISIFLLLFLVVITIIPLMNYSLILTI